MAITLTGIGKHFKNRWGRYAIGGALVALLTVPRLTNDPLVLEGKYRAAGQDFEVVYTEGVCASDGFLCWDEENVLEARTGDDRYRMIDRDDETDLDGADFNGQALEEMVVSTEKGSETYYRPAQGAEGIRAEGEHELFDLADRLYDSLRGGLRKQQKEKYNGAVGSFPRVPE